MAWVSGEPTNGRYVIVPPGSDDYMQFRSKKQFTDLGEPKDDWIEFDVSRIPMNTCCEFNNCTRLRFRILKDYDVCKLLVKC